ncbi:MAG: hypothetical protein INR69_17435 [Mucilaginibacter polytrichastri]|nr:hypothetical protein [Mucilaginibacter polytrichastri]
MQNSIPERVIHLNVPQQKVQIVDANITALIAGRGTGKTSGVITPLSLRNIKEMPRGATAFMSPTYYKIKAELLPEWGKGMERYGFYEDVDFWVGKQIPKHIDHERAFQHPRDPRNSVFFRNGHVIRLIGMDRKDSAAGLSNDYNIVDEAKYVKEKDFNGRVIPANRGNEDVFAHLHFHHGILLCTDMPTDPAGQWVMKYEDMMDPEQIELIVNFEFERSELLAEMKRLVMTEQLHEQLEKRMRRRLRELDQILFDLRRECVHFVEATTLDNIDVLGEKYIRQMKLVLTDLQFRTSILNERLTFVENKFYPNFDHEVHGYEAINYRYVEEQSYMLTLPEPWKKHDDLDLSRPLDIACDWNNAFTSMVVGQEFRYEYRFQNALWAKDRKKTLGSLSKVFNEYYGKSFPRREVNFYYDHTAVHLDASREETFADEFSRLLKGFGWKVNKHYIGQASNHDVRMKMWKNVHAGESRDGKPVAYNTSTCSALITAIQNTPARLSDKGYKKDKTSERKGGVKAEESTHLTEAHDTLYEGVQRRRREVGSTTSLMPIMPGAAA